MKQNNKQFIRYQNVGMLYHHNYKIIEKEKF